ncbi:FxsA family protein [Alteromonas sp. ASW11-130]|uniref:FxsA family protein n=1 Tax=Alteromonas sp. ASW11-130 TaxID=3015775 RepID=UPI0022420A69|nr:FxsA family protein [Alteromonas sp. ASW11-130]MCW8093236.1 membrane protein FxsA [Alteromonas sp. ASW11-130]
MRNLFLLFAIMPIIEIAVLVQVGDVIGGWNTIALVLISAFVGAYFVRREGVNTLKTAQQKMQSNQIPGQEMLEGLMLVVAGVLLVTPGFITDTFGLLLVLPPSRKFFAQKLKKHLSMQVVTGASFHSHEHYKASSHPQDKDSDIIEGEYQDKSDTNNNKRLD